MQVCIVDTCTCMWLTGALNLPPPPPSLSPSLPPSPPPPPPPALSLSSSLDFEDLPHCPQKSGMGACMFPTSGSEEGVALGYLLGDMIEEATGVLRLSYYNGDKCESSGRSHVVNIYFQCEKGSGMVGDMYMYMYMHVLIHLHVHICTCTCILVQRQFFVEKRLDPNVAM